MTNDLHHPIHGSVRTNRSLVRLLTICAFWAAAAVPLSARASSIDATLEYRIKGAYLYNFTKFVGWPPPTAGGDASTFVIGVLDRGADSPAAATIAETLGGKTATGRIIDVRTFTEISPAISACQLIFVTRSAQQDLAAVRAAVGDHHVLIVGENEGFAQRGGTINLVVMGDNVRCEINLRQAERAGLKLSARLASVSRLVREEGSH